MSQQVGDWTAFCLAMAAIVTLALVGVYDVYAIYGQPGMRTASSYIRAWSADSAVLPFVAGMIAGHLFFSVPGK